KRARVLVVIDRSPDDLSGMVAAGPGSYVDQLLSIIGADNVLGDSKVRYPRIAAEQIRRSRPDVIIDASADAAKHLGAWKRLADVEAVAKGRVVPTSDRRLTSPSVQAPSMLPEFERMVYGSSSDESATGQGH
ncbi:MAG: ABC transporter substrate-binding protein, partial [Deltaproteobacteria bacterium]|nr:ABC transporter substrate-binding protein [Deltaproteobacteria bacterium]